MTTEMVSTCSWFPEHFADAKAVYAPAAKRDGHVQHGIEAVLVPAKILNGASDFPGGVRLAEDVGAVLQGTCEELQGVVIRGLISRWPSNSVRHARVRITNGEDDDIA